MSHAVPAAHRHLTELGLDRDVVRDLCRIPHGTPSPSPSWATPIPQPPGGAGSEEDAEFPFLL
jgi:hypothetical protein